MNPNDSDFKFQLSGFGEVDEAAKDEASKLIIKHRQRLMEHALELNDVHVDLKTIHKREKGELYEVHVRIKDKGKFFVSEVHDRNLFAAIDSGLTKVIHELEHHNGKLKEKG